MEPHDDPEARIRDLERPLAESARTSELGTQPYGAGPHPTRPYADPYPPPPAVGYGTPYPPPPPPHMPSRHRGGWLIAVAVMVAGGAAAVAGVLAFTNMVSDVASVFDPGDNSPTAAPSINIEIPPMWTSVPDVSVPGTDSPSGPTVVAPGEQVNISGVGEQRTVICEAGMVNVSGVDNNVQITGSCLALSVSGVRNTIIVESSDGIGVSGFDNKVSYRTSDPKITQSGTGNLIERG